MNKIVIGAVTAVVVGVGGAAGWYFLGKDSGPGFSAASAPPVDCSTVKADVDAAFAALPPEVKATYAGLECTPERLLFAELRFATLGAGGAEQGAVKLSTVTVEGAFGANARKIFNPASYTAGQAPSTERLPLLTRLTAAKVTVGPEQGGASFENLDIANLSARQFGKAPPTTLAGLGSLTPAEALDALQAFSFESLGFKNLAGGPPGATSPVLTIASVALSAFDGARLGALDITSISAAPSDQPGKVSIGSIALKGVGVGDLASIISADAGGMANGDAQQIKTLLAISADAFAVKNFEVTAFDGPDDRLKVASVTIDKLKSLALERLAIEGLEGFSSNAEVAFSVGSMALTGVDVGTALQGLAAGTATEPDFSKLRIDGYELSNLAIGPKDGDKVTIASLTATSSDYVDGIATRGTAKLAGFVFPATVIESVEDRQPLIDLGYDAIKLEMTTDYAYDPKTKVMDLKDFTLKLLDGATLKLTFNFTDFDVKALQEASASMQPPLALLGAKVVKLTLAYADDSLIQRVLKLAAKEQGITADELLAQGKQIVAMQAEQAPGPVTKAAVAGVAAFLDNPKKLTIDLAPGTPVSFAELGAKFEDLEALAVALGLKVSAN